MSSPFESAASTPSEEGQCTVEREPHLFRFGLRQWFLFVSATVVLCALLARLDGVWPIVVASVVALIGAHVFGAIVGSRLRDTSADVYRWKARPESPDRDEPIALPQPVALAELSLPDVTPLANRGRSWKWSHWAVALGGVAGGALGGFGIARLAGEQTTGAGLALGAVSCGVLGAWGSLLASSFWAIARQAWRHAQRHE